jgi:two-component system, chemotaxis family, sensor kinase CheA
MIEDKELCDLFRMECEEHLQHLDDGLLAIEQQHGTPELLEDVFRAAHSIKGAARMLDLTEIQAIAHSLEDSLVNLRKGECQLTGEMAETVNQQLQKIRGLVAQAVGGPLSANEPSTPENTSPQAPVEQVLQTSAVPESPALSLKTSTTNQKSEAKVSDSPYTIPTDSAPQQPVSNYRVDTLRINPVRVDELLTNAGELTVTHKHIERRLEDVDALIDQFEELQRNYQRWTNTDASDLLKPVHDNLIRIKSGFHEDCHRLNRVSDKITQTIHTIRLMPFSNLFSQFPRMVHDLAKSLNKKVSLELVGGDVVVDKHILEQLKDPLVHLIRNALHHGLESTAERLAANKPEQGSICIRALHASDYVILEISDDGHGFNLDKIKQRAVRSGLKSEEQLAQLTEEQLYDLVMTPGFSTADSINEISGRGVGLDVVHTNIEQLKGQIRIQSQKNQGITFTLRVPLTLATMRVQTIRSGAHCYVIPLEYIRYSTLIKRKDIFMLEGKPTIQWNDQPIAVIDLATILELTSADQESADDTLIVTILMVDNDLFGIFVDELLDETEITLKPNCKLLKRIPNVSASTILVSGEVSLVLNPVDILNSMRTRFELSSKKVSNKNLEKPKSPKSILLAEDSITTRTQEKRILEAAGFLVTTAVDGLDAYSKFKNSSFDAIISDIEMPNMNGLSLAEAIRKNKRHEQTPIILVTSLSSEADQRRGLEAGANAYIVKSRFDQNTLLETLDRLL